MLCAAKRAGALAIHSPPLLTRPWLVWCVLPSLLALAACGGSDNDEPTPAPTPCDQAADCEVEPELEIPAVELVEAFPGLTFEAPVAVRAIPASSGGYVVLERAGAIYRVDDQGKELVGDLRPLPLIRESGLWNIAFSPNFEQNNQVYLYYGIDVQPFEEVDVAGQLSRFDFDNINPASATSLLRLLDVTGATGGFSNIHFGGGLDFDAEGYLYLGVGDGGPQGDPRGYGQATTKLAGKILKLDVEGVEGDGNMIPAENPFAETPGCADGCDEIFAYGFRNPWQLSFDDHGRLWVADVGRADFEEVDLVESGGNYGWSIMEGPECHRSPDCDESGLIQPVASYEAGEDRGAISGGFVYRGRDIPALAGYYVYGDFVDGVIRATFGEPPFPSLVLLNTDLAIVSLGEDGGGEILVVDMIGGEIYRLAPASRRRADRRRPSRLPQRAARAGPAPLQRRGLAGGVRL